MVFFLFCCGSISSLLFVFHGKEQEQKEEEIEKVKSLKQNTRANQEEK